MPGSQTIGFVSNDYPVDTVFVKFHPRKGVKSVISEKPLKRFSFTETSDIVESGVKYSFPAAVCLKASSNLEPLLQHRYVISVFCKHITTLQATETRTYDYDSLSGHVTGF